MAQTVAREAGVILDAIIAVQIQPHLLRVMGAVNRVPACVQIHAAFCAQDIAILHVAALVLIGLLVGHVPDAHQLVITPAILAVQPYAIQHAGMTVSTHHIKHTIHEKNRPRPDK